MFNTLFKWIVYVLQEIGKVGTWLITPITFGSAEERGIVDLSTNGVILDSTSASVKLYNFFLRLFTNNWDASSSPSITIIPIYVISVTFISAIFIALFIKVWFRR